MTLKRWFILFALVALTFAGAWVYTRPTEHHQHFARIQPGMTASDVEEILGPSRGKVFLCFSTAKYDSWETWHFRHGIRVVEIKVRYKGHRVVAKDLDASWRLGPSPDFAD